MDFLGSILDNMDQPPVISSKQKELMKEQKKAMEKAKLAERELLNKFREKIEERVSDFVQNSTVMKYAFEPMTVVERSVVRDTAEVAGLTAYVFGMDEESRYVMVFKKEYALTDEEHDSLRKGIEYDPIKTKEEADKKKAQQLEDAERAKRLRKEKGPLKFMEKYERLVGKNTGREGAIALEATKNQQFGFVKSELKKDKRTIEEALADIKAKKLKRLQPDQPDMDKTP